MRRLPISSLGTTAAITEVLCAIPKPIPNAITTSGIIISIAVALGSRKMENINIPIVATSVLAKITYFGFTFPVSAPPIGEANTIAAAIGINK